MSDGELWCFFRGLISQGTYIQMDYAAGKYKCYEEFSARLDEAARERVAHFQANRALQRQSSQETPPAPEPPEKTWDCVCGRSNYVTYTRCEHCGFQRATANRRVNDV